MIAPPSLSSMRHLLEPFLPALARTGLLALACNAMLELARIVEAVFSGAVPWSGKTPVFPLLFLLDIAVTWVAIGLLHAVVGSIRLTTALSATTTALIVVVDYEKLRVLEEPLYPGDWEFAGNVGFMADMVGARILLLLPAVLVLALVTATAASRAAEHWVSRPVHPPSRWHSGLARLLTATLCLGILHYLGSFNSPGNAARGAFELFGANWSSSSPEANYLRHGFVGGFLSNLEVPMPAPAGYSRAEMARVSETYGAIARRINRMRDPHALDDVNVVLLLSETFTDPLAVKGLHLEQDPIQFVRRMMGSTTAGNMLSQSIGGKTANMEFEALTGMSVSLFPRQARLPYQAIVPDYATFPSAAAWMKNRGQRAVAIHPNIPQLYRRRDVYRTFGFDEFIYDREMHVSQRIGHHAWISDAATFEELTRLLRTEEQPVLVNLVTIQNHTPYGGRYDDPVEVTGPDGEPLVDVGQYVRGLTHSDHAVENLIHRLSRSDERTVVVFYGDHQPGGLYPRSVLERSTWRLRHQTPFFVWANFPGVVRNMPTTSPVHFMWLALERANAPVAPYDALLHAMWQEIPAMDAGLVIGRRNRQIRASSLSPHARRVLHDYRLVQYDLSVGERYGESAMFAVP